MDKEAYDEIDIPDVSHGSKRTLCIRGGYGRSEVYVGICADAESMPNDLIAVDGRALKKAIDEFHMGEAPRGARCGGCVHYGRHKPEWEPSDFWPRWHGHCCLHKKMAHANERGCPDWTKDK